MSTTPCPFCGSTTTYTPPATDVVRCTACFNVLPSEPKSKAVAPPEPAKPAKQSAGVRSKKQAAPKPIAVEDATPLALARDSGLTVQLTPKQTETVREMEKPAPKPDEEQAQGPSHQMTTTARRPHVRD